MMMGKRKMSLCGSDNHKERLVKRLNRIEGQIRGLVNMVKEDRDCIEVLRQTVSASQALRGVWLQVVDDHLRGCVSEAIANKKNGDDLIDELMNQIEKLK